MVVAAIAVVAVSGPGAADAAAVAKVQQRSFTVPTPAAPGPKQYNKAFVTAFGRKKARDVLVLMPGTFGGAGDFTLLARSLVRRNPKLQVWAVDRREEALEDTTVFRKAARGEIPLEEAFGYYLGWLTSDPPAERYRKVQVTNPYYAFAREWGMKTVLKDTRAVVNRARRSGKRVILGGHSVGASLAISYAAWDFGGRPGFRDLEGLVLIDGGLLGSFDPYNLQEAKAAMAAMEAKGPFSDLIGLGIPELAGIFAELGGLYALQQPTEPATAFEEFELLPDFLKPPVPSTNRAFLGFNFDRDTSPEFMSSLHVNAGRLDTSVSPADWLDGGITPVHRLAVTFGQEPPNAVDWFFPTRITIDANGADRMRMNPVAKYLGLRLFHTGKVNLPFYVVQTDMTGGKVLKGARNWLKRTRSPRRRSVLVNADPQMSHLDPLVALPRRNVFIKTVTPFLKKTFAPAKKKKKRNKRRGGR